MIRAAAAITMSGCDDDLKKLSNLMVEDHVFAAIDHRLRSFFGAHQFFRAVAAGTVRVYALLAEKGEFLGCFFGAFAEETREFEAHAMFRRGVDVVNAVPLAEAEMKRDFREQRGVEVVAVVGYIPVVNRAAARMARRAGYEVVGTVCNGECNVFKKTMKG